MTSKLVNCNSVDLAIYSVIYLGGAWGPHLRLYITAVHQSWKGADVCQGSCQLLQVGDGKQLLLALTEGT